MTSEELFMLVTQRIGRDNVRQRHIKRYLTHVKYIQKARQGNLTSKQRKLREAANA